MATTEGGRAHLTSIFEDSIRNEESETRMSTYLSGCEVFEIDSDSNRKINNLWTNAENTFI